MFSRNRSPLIPCISYLVLIFCLVISISCHTSKMNKRDSDGYTKIFNGKTLEGWEGDPVYWRVEDGAMVGEIIPSTVIKRNTFIIWRGGQPKDFELKVDYKVTPGGNSGINYRSEELTDARYSLKGYQSDIDGANKYTGQNYEERGRTFLALRGQQVVLENDKKPIVTKTLAREDSLLAHIKNNDWNEVHLIVKGNHMLHYVNGVLMSEVTDNDTVNRKFEGWIGVQVHVGPPMKIFYRNFRIKNI